MWTHTCYASPYVSAAISMNMHVACGLSLVPSDLDHHKIGRPFLYHHLESVLWELRGPLDAVFNIYTEDMRMASSSPSATVLRSDKGNLEKTSQSTNSVDLRNRQFPARARYLGVEPIAAFRRQHAPPMRSLSRSAYSAS